MNLEPNEEERSRRAAARDWLTSHVPADPLPPMDTPEGAERHREWERRLAAARWSVVHWPGRFGGRDYGPVDWLLFEEEYHTAGAPARINHNGITLLGATLLEHGSTEQQERHLPAMATGETVWAQAWSEPEAGSDLAGVRCRAERVPGGYRLYGQKTWSSRAAVADRGFGLFRSEPGSARSRGLTYLMFPLCGEGVQVRPIARMDGEPVFAEIFFDGLFAADDDVVGEPGHGWQIAMSTAGKERGVTLRSPGRFLAVADRLVEAWRRLPAQRRNGYRDAVQDVWLAAQAYRLHGFAGVNAEQEPASASLGKPFWSDLDVAMHETGLAIVEELLDGAGEPDPADPAGAAELAGWHEQFRDGLLFALAGPIYAGTNEIQHNIVAERVLGLPRG